MAKSKDNIEDKIPFVRSVLLAIGSKELTLLEVHERYIRLRPRSLFSPAADIRTVDVYLKTLSQPEHGYIKQDVVQLDDKKGVKTIRYSLTSKSFSFLSPNKK